MKVHPVSAAAFLCRLASAALPDGGASRVLQGSSMSMSLPELGLIYGPWNAGNGNGWGKSGKGKGSKGSKPDTDKCQTKSSKSSKGRRTDVPSASPTTNLVCLEFGQIFDINGPTTPIVGAGQDVSACNPGFPAPNPDYDPDACTHYFNPWVINRSVGTVASFGFADVAGAPLGAGAVCANTISDSDGGDATGVDKFRLAYVGELTTPFSEVALDLFNKPLSILEKLSYDFYVESCPSGDASCPGQFYLNIYARTNTTNDFTNYYDCRFDYLINIGGGVGTWNTVAIDANTKPVRSCRNSACDPCRADGITDLDVALSLNEYIAAVAEQGDTATLSNSVYDAFVINIGQSTDSDAGLAGCIDNVRLKVAGEDSTRVYDFEPN